MSGHSKWSTIKRQKGANDAKRGQIFTKLSNAITIAVREGGGITDPEFNFKLRIAIDKARASNMPKENIERSIERASGAGANALMEAVYEGFAPHGIAVMVQAVTDNKQRTIAEIKNIFDKNGGTLGNPGSVAYLFEQKGELLLKKNGKSSDDLLMIAMEAGAEDLEDLDDEVILYTQPSELAEVKKKLETQNTQIENAELVYKPKTATQITDNAEQEKIINFLEKVEDLADVQKVFTNADFVTE